MAPGLADLLTRAGALSQPQLDEALNYQRTNGGGLEGAVIALGFVTDDEITAILSRQTGVPAVDLARFEFEAGVAGLIPPAMAHKHQVVALGRDGATLRVATADPGNVIALDDIRFVSGCNVEPRVASGTAVADAIRRLYGPRTGTPGASPQQTGSDGAVLAVELRDDAGAIEILDAADADAGGAPSGRQAAAAPVVRLVNALLAAAIQRGASDVHVEPYDAELRIRFRIDGMLYPVSAPPLALRDAVISRLR